MGRIGKLKELLGFTRGDASLRRVRADTGGKYTITGDLYQPAGDDTAPRPDDWVAMVKGVDGRHHVVGVLDPKNTNTAASGERRLYSRKADGSVAASVHLKKDGEVEVKNDAADFTVKPDGQVEMKNSAGGFIRLLPDGSVSINGVTISLAGALVAPVSVGAPSVSAAGKELASHTHPAGTPNTGPNN